MPHLRKASASVNRRLKELKILLKGDPAQPNELDGRIEEKLASVVQMKDLLSSVEPRKKRLWNDLLGGMVNDLSKRSRLPCEAHPSTGYSSCFPNEQQH